MLILLTQSIHGVSSFRYSDGRQNPATHFPTCCPFTKPPSYSCSFETVINDINKNAKYIIPDRFFIILTCEAVVLSCNVLKLIHTVWVEYYHWSLLQGM